MSLTDFSSDPGNTTLVASVSDVQPTGTEPSPEVSGAADGANAPNIMIDIHDFEIRIPYTDINFTDVT